MHYLNLCLLVALGLWNGYSLWGQPPEPMYSFAHKQSSYQPLTAPVILNPGVDYMGHDHYTVPLGFEFDFFGRPLHSIEVQRGGTVFFGAEDEFVAPFRPLLTILPGSQISYQLETQGLCGQQVMKLEWKDMGVLGLEDTILGMASFQMWLYEGSQRLELHYGPRSFFSEGTFFNTNAYHVHGPRLRITRTGQMAVVLGGYDSPVLVQNSDSLGARSTERLTGIPPEGSVYHFIPLENTREPLVRIGPNPSSGWVHLEFPNAECQIYHLTFADLLGRVYFQAETREQRLTLDLKAFPSGWYILRMDDREGAHLASFKVRLIGDL